MIRITLVCILLYLHGCSSLTKNDGSVITRPFSAVDANRNIVLAPNHTFEIVLPSNPTTGYDWNVLVSNPDVVGDVSSKYSKDASGRIGAGGATTWTLRTGKIGETTLAFSYLRPWEKDTVPTRVVIFTINVR